MLILPELTETLESPQLEGEARSIMVAPSGYSVDEAEIVTAVAWVVVAGLRAVVVVVVVAFAVVVTLVVVVDCEDELLLEVVVVFAVEEPELSGAVVTVGCDVELSCSCGSEVF